MKRVTWLVQQLFLKPSKKVSHLSNYKLEHRASPALYNLKQRPESCHWCNYKWRIEENLTSLAVYKSYNSEGKKRYYSWFFCVTTRQQKRWITCKLAKIESGKYETYTEFEECIAGTELKYSIAVKLTWLWLLQHLKLAYHC